MMKLQLMLCFFLVTALCYGASITIYNDSPFPLTATVAAADGKIRGTITVASQHQETWHDPSPPNAIYSQTPYSVTFICKNGKQFGVASNVSPGAWVTANQSSGSHSCKIEENRDQIQQKTLSQEKETKLKNP